MPNGKPGDHPITDMLLHDAHPFPKDMEAMILKLHAANPDSLNEIWNASGDWRFGRNLDEGRKLLNELSTRFNVN